MYRPRDGAQGRAGWAGVNVAWGLYSQRLQAFALPLTEWSVNIIVSGRAILTGKGAKPHLPAEPTLAGTSYEGSRYQHAKIPASGPDEKLTFTEHLLCIKS